MIKTLLEKSRSGTSINRCFDNNFDNSLVSKSIPKSLLRSGPIGLPELTEVEVVRHYTALSRASFGVDNGSYPLGSCTMKYNPKRNDYYANLDNFKYVHPEQPTETMAGIWELLFNLQKYIAELTGMDTASLVPAAGAHGEFAGLLMIKKYFEKRGEKRNVIIIPDSAHGTNPASATMAGFTCRLVPTNAEGLFDVEKLSEVLDDSVAAVMITNPSTFGLFEEQILNISEKIHKNGSLLYGDGANMNALMGIARFGDMGFDVVHLNAHKTLSAPHGGGGPGSGPVAVKKILEPFLPIPVIVEKNGGYMPLKNRADSIGRIKSFYGHIGVLIKAYAYIRTMGAQGLKEASENAVLNANYLQHRLREIFPPVFDKLCMHECLLSGEKLPTSTLNFAKRLIDYGIHPPTMIGAGCVYFPSDLTSAMLIEPTESETKESLDTMVEVFEKIYSESMENAGFIENAPYTASIAKIQNQSDASCTIQ